MHLSVGIFELVLPAVLGLVSLLLRWRRSKLLQTAEIAFACSCGATLLSPADLASTLIFTVAFFLCFQLGTRFKKPVKKDVTMEKDVDQSQSSWMNPFRFGVVVVAFGVAIFAFGQFQLWQQPAGPLAHQVFRAWAASWIGTILLVLSAAFWGYNFASRQMLSKKDASV
ncbi:hypothetical protein [Rhodopirellula bahusiensis]|uniref:Transmembrane protein n=1 Tax=Rhodopirellula bahusiensis TaxID=2014065 RepID=A0A2G1VYV7_9BACT|nr:hypothetical protein [Rhodopirellula bahusiensis]PHQ31978.1 hypothetical protein CEE69_28370 [Rhodopirellula bahusiensis]